MSVFVFYLFIIRSRPRRRRFVACIVDANSLHGRFDILFMLGPMLLDISAKTLFDRGENCFAYERDKNTDEDDADGEVEEENDLRGDSSWPKREELPIRIVFRQACLEQRTEYHHLPPSE